MRSSVSWRSALFSGAVLGLFLVAACGKSQEQAAAPATSEPAAATPAAAAVEPAAPAAAPSSEPTQPHERLVAPVRGTVDVGYLAPKTKVAGDMVVTTFQVKNLSSGAIAGLQIDEFWWDREGNPVTGGRARLSKPLQPGETQTMTLETPKNPKMFRNTYQFTHAYGRVNTKQLARF